MTPKEKARELVNKFFSNLETSIDLHLVGRRKSHAKDCAIICVYEIINTLIVRPIRTETYYQTKLYWEEVKQEIEKL